MMQANIIKNSCAHYTEKYLTFAVTLTTLGSLISFSLSRAVDTNVSVFYFICFCSLSIIAMYESAINGYRKVFEQSKDSINQLLKNSDDFAVFKNSVLFLKDGKHSGEVRISTDYRNEMMLSIFNSSGQALDIKLLGIKLGKSNSISKAFQQKFFRHVVSKAENEFLPLTI